MKCNKCHELRGDPQYVAWLDLMSPGETFRLHGEGCDCWWCAVKKAYDLDNLSGSKAQLLISLSGWNESEYVCSQPSCELNDGDKRFVKIKV